MGKSRPLAERFEAKIIREPNSGCWLWAGSLDTGGYGLILAFNGGTAKTAHRISWELHRGPIPKGIDVLHKCDTPCCVRPDHLTLGTHAENMADMVRKRRQARGDALSAKVRGERNGHAKLTEDDVRAIRAATGTNQDIASRFGVKHVVISQIRSRTRWRHVS